MWTFNFGISITPKRQCRELIGHDELPGVLVEDVLDEDGSIRDILKVVGKRGKTRYVAINEPIREAIAKYMDVRRPARGVETLIVSIDGGRLGQGGAEKLMRGIRRRAGLDEVQWHDLRRFALTQMWIGEMDSIDLRAVAGHADERTTLRYIRAGIAIRAVQQHRAKSPAVSLNLGGGAS